MRNLQGHLLIAVPDLEDGNFFRSVVLMLHHDQFGASGVVLNRPTEVTVREAWQNSVSENTLPADEILQEEKIQIGGPVDGPLIVLHENSAMAEQNVMPGVYMSVDRDSVEQIIRQPASRFRVYSGYSGWAPNQLETEVDAGGWMITRANSNHVFSDAPELWSNVCEMFSASVIGLPVRPGADPNLN